MRLDARDLVDLGPDLCQQLAVRRHYFRNYSFGDAGYRPAVSAQRRVALLVGAFAVAAVVVVAVAVVSSDGSSGETNTQAATTSKPREGRPPLSFALGFRTDPEARDLARGQSLYARGELAAAAALFTKHDSLEGKVGAALAGWPEGSLDRLEQLAKLYPERGGRAAPPRARPALGERGRPDRGLAIRARGGARHALRRRRRQPAAPEPPARDFRRSSPPFRRPPGSRSLLPPASSKHCASPPSTVGVASNCCTASASSGSGGRSRQRASSIGRRAAYPGDAEAQVAGAVGQFDKDAPERAFGRLGPLSRTYPDEPTVRFHLGVLLLWTGRIDEAQRQFRLAANAQPGSPLAREALRYLGTIRGARG